jgi:multidrug efflux pump subunit AcrA (membrane-fusion protein)
MGASNMKRIVRIITIVFILGGLSVPLLGCSAESEEAGASENQEATVQRGNLTIDITAAGNLALSRTEDLAFEIAGTVEEVLVEEGDVVEEGQVLARLDTSEWEDNLSALEDQVAAKERDLVQKEINLRNAEIALEKAQDTYEWPELEEAEADVEEAEARLQYALDRGYDSLVPTYSALLDAAEKRLNAMLSDADTDEIAIKKLELELAQGRLEDAEKALSDAQEALDEAREKSPVIAAPFDGFITRVNVEGGDEVMTGTVAVQLADPQKFEADIMVSEMDILQVELGGQAWVQVDAREGLSIPAEITHIAPTANIQSGVVNYEVKVEVQSLEAIAQQRQQEKQEATRDISSGELPERLKQAIEAGQITQEQAEEMMEQRQQGGGEQQGQVPMTTSENFQLREGLTVTVSIIIDERTDVLLVPNGAITRQGMETIVQVLNDGVAEERSIEPGISNWQYTEVTEGLSEGERVVVPQGITTSATSSKQGGSVIRIPGMGGSRPQ